MLRVIQNSNPAGAKSYYSSADYYTEGQELTGIWRGKAAKRLGLAGEVTKKTWDALCGNRDPGTGETLTARRKENRRVGYDFNWHCPKSVSILFGLTGDERILEAFRDAVGATMDDIESEMQARVRAKGGNEDRTTGNAVWGEFIHTTARPIDGVPDPHLHAHCFVHNVTWDGEEGRWKAGQFAALKRDAPYFEALFHARLARKLEELGLPTVRTKAGWELDGMPASAIATFSRRTAEIEQKAKEKGITDPKEKGELGAKTRKAKAGALSVGELREAWRSRLSTEEGDAVAALARRIGGEAIPEDRDAAGIAAARAVSHCFERQSVVPERTFLAAALKGGAGKAKPESVRREVARQPLLKAERGGRTCVTTREVLAEERAMIDFARKGRGSCRPLALGEHAFRRGWLNADQRRAVEHVLHSPDRVIVLRGGAGTGKTTAIKETVEAIEAAGRRVFTVAPSADASRGVLRQEGFADADTVARLLMDEKLQGGLKGQVVWVDEAGLLSSRQTARLFDLASKLDARLILSGDRRQHASVERGSPLRLLEEEAGVIPAEIREIQRQKGAYKEAVRALAEGRTEDGFRRLDGLGWVREVPDEERYRLLAEDYVAAVKAGKTALVVSPTHREGGRITGEIRSELKLLGRLGTDARAFEILESRNLTEAERADPVSYGPGDVLVFHQNARGVVRGQRVAVGEAALPLDQAGRFGVFRRGEIRLAAGDLVRITRNGETVGGTHRLNNGALYTVRGFDDAGNIELTNGWTIARDFGHLSYGYCVTSHAAQGKTVDIVFIGQSADSLPASNAAQFYVSASRAKEAAVIYTDDKRALLEAVARVDERASASDLARERGVINQRLADAQRGAEPSRQPQRERSELVYG